MFLALLLCFLLLFVAVVAVVLYVHLVSRQTEILNRVRDLGRDVAAIRRQAESGRDAETEREGTRVPAVPAPGLSSVAMAAPAPSTLMPLAPSPPPPPVAAAPVPTAVATAQPAAPAPREPGQLEAATRSRLRKIRNWILFGAESLPEGVSIEYAVATNWLLRAGILIILLGVGFFLKYSFDSGWLDERARAVLSILTGVAMVVVGLRLVGGRYHLLGLGALGGGFVVLYWSIYALTVYYDILSQLWALPLVVVVTVAAGTVAVRLNSPLVALIGILGAYGSPVLLALRETSPVPVYSYLLVLGIGVLAVSLCRNWYLLNYLGLLFTYGLFAFLQVRSYETADFWLVMPFLVAFFVLYAAVMYAHNFVRRKQSNLLELIGQGLNAAAAFGLAFALVTDAYSQEWVGAVTIALTGFYTLHVFFFLRRGLHDRALLLTLTALAAFFLTITMPIVLSSQWLTATWAIQAFLMLWLGAKLDSRFLRDLAYAVYSLTLFRLVFLDLGREFGHPVDTAGLGHYARALVSRCVVFGVPVASLFGASRLHSTAIPPAALNVERVTDVAAPPRVAVLGLLFWVPVLLLFLYLHLELGRMFATVYAPLRLPVLTWLWIAMCTFLALRQGRQKSRLAHVLLWLFLGGLLCKVLVVDLGEWGLEVERLVYSRYSFMEAFMRLLDLGAVVGFLWAAAALMPRAPRRAVSLHKVLGVLSLALLFLFTTLELNTFLLAFVGGFRAGGISILWSLFALSFVLVGILRASRPFRFTGLVLFVVIVGKVFASDLARLDPLFRIVAFIALGMLVLSGSFLYLRYRHRFVEAGEHSEAGPREGI